LGFSLGGSSSLTRNIKKLDEVEKGYINIGKKEEAQFYKNSPKKITYKMINNKIEYKIRRSYRTV